LARLVLVSNRIATPGRKGSAQAGGLAVAIRSVSRRHRGIWLGWRGEIATKSNTKVRAIRRGHQSYVMTDLTEEDYREYYKAYANRVLWPPLHYRLDLAEFSRRDLSGLCGSTTPSPLNWASFFNPMMPAGFTTITCSAGARRSATAVIGINRDFPPYLLSAARASDRASEPRTARSGVSIAAPCSPVSIFPRERRS
jgi:hypothetical protein